MSSFRQLMMRNKGGGVEFKDYIYSIDGAYILFNTDRHIERFYACDVSFMIKSRSTYGIVNFRRYYDDYSLGNMRVIGETSGSYRTYLTINLTGTDTEIGDVSYQTDNVFNNINIYNSSSVYAKPTVKLLYYQMTANFLLKNIVFYGENNTKVAELKPAIVNGENGLYDTVGNQFYGNSNSSGSLVCE